MSDSKTKSLINEALKWENSDYTMPVLFVGHGAPLYVLSENKYTLAWRKLGESIKRPKAVVCISAHWLTRGNTSVTAMPKPKTIHDFGPFDPRLFEMRYPAPGSPDLAGVISDNIREPAIHPDHDWGYDHGTWCVLYHMFPEADVPVIQLSIDYDKDGQFHFDLGKKLSFLRKKGVLIVCSGNIVHNLRLLTFPESSEFDWAIEFDEESRNLIEDGDFKSLISYRKLGKAANLSIPTPDHYFPLLYALGLKTNRDQISFPVDGIAYGSTSMRSVLIQQDQ